MTGKIGHDYEWCNTCRLVILFDSEVRISFSKTMSFGAGARTFLFGSMRSRRLFSIWYPKIASFLNQHFPSSLKCPKR